MGRNGLSGANPDEAKQSTDSVFAATLYGAGDLRWEPRPLGGPSAGNVHIRLAAAGICGSDLHYYRHGSNADFTLKEPLVLGHELAGIVTNVGEGVTGLVPGSRVAVNPARPCGVCPACEAGRPNLCADVYFMGSASKVPHMHGGFASVFEVAASQCVPVSAQTSLEHAALAEPLAVALHAATRGLAAVSGDNSVEEGSATRSRGLSVAVVGSGPIGLMILLALRRSGLSDLTAVDIEDAPLQAAQRAGASRIVNSSTSSTSEGALPQVDLAFEASGNPSGLATALRTVRPGGTVVQVGNLPAGDVLAPLNLVMLKELNLIGTFRFGQEYYAAVKLIDDGTIDVGPLITGQVPLSNAKAGFDLALDRQRSVKVLLTGE